MPDVRLVYYSEATRDMSLLDIQSILEVARENNKKQGLCGMLCYESLWFLQTLEGDRDELNQLFLHISKDERHENVVIVSYEEIDERTFTSWNMGYAGSSSVFKEALQSIGEDEFSPEEMTPQQCLDFLIQLSNHQEA
jgi:hypothetical protein